MASKYIQKFPIPEGFAEVLHDLSKEILRNQPADILDFCAEYFKCVQEGTVLDYQNKGQNIPCDFKTGVPKISERPLRKKPLNERDEALHNAALENSAGIAKKPMTPDAKLLQADSLKSEKQSKHSGKASTNKDKDRENLVINLKGDSKAYGDAAIASESNKDINEKNENNQNKDINEHNQNKDINENNDFNENTQINNHNENNEIKHMNDHNENTENNQVNRENTGSAKGSLKSESKCCFFQNKENLLKIFDSFCLIFIFSAE